MQIRGLFGSVALAAAFALAACSSPQSNTADNQPSSGVGATVSATQPAATSSPNPPPAAAATTDTCQTYLTWPESQKAQAALAAGLSGVDDFTNAVVIVFWHELNTSCARNPGSSFADTALSTLKQVNSKFSLADNNSDPGAFKESLTATFDRPGSVGAKLTLTPIVHDKSVVLIIHASGWVARNAAGTMYPGFLISWGDGMYTHANEGTATCVTNPQYVNLNDTYYFKYDYPAPGSYQIFVGTRACIGAGAYDDEQILQQTTDPVMVGR